MKRAWVWVQDHELHVGDRVRIRPDRWPLIGVEDQIGTVVDVFALPRDSYLVQIDGDTKRGRVWFFYRAEVAVVEPEPQI